MVTGDDTMRQGNRMVACAASLGTLGTAPTLEACAQASATWLRLDPAAAAHCRLEEDKLMGTCYSLQTRLRALRDAEAGGHRASNASAVLDPSQVLSLALGLVRSHGLAAVELVECGVVRQLLDMVRPRRTPRGSCGQRAMARRWWCGSITRPWTTLAWWWRRCAAAALRREQEEEVAAAVAGVASAQVRGDGGYGRARLSPCSPLPYFPRSGHRRGWRPRRAWLR